ncbi:Metallo-dependent phosphatase [Violaceomyces palustris]|uniref:Metallo-dependent phosphatase n=1 Tax=Violaceomyces palustris TaxID=1673888 RepID=A0ACD0P7I2_9BASI|nr:Metallo-dependent phosphatase [Violaceomyces palustris]
MFEQESTGVTCFADYELSNPPKITSETHVRFVIVSDTHSTQPHVPDGDVLLHCGDLTDLGTDDAIQKQIEWIKSLPHPIKIIIAGNHDFAACNVKGWYESRGVELHSMFNKPISDTERVKKFLQSEPPHFVYLENQSFEFFVNRPGVSQRKWKVFGSPWTPEFENWAWNYGRGEMAKEVLSGIPSDIDILLTHGPPHAIGGLDVIHDGRQVGCEELTRKLREGEITPAIHAFGHIHEARGVHTESFDRDGRNDTSTLFVNAALVEYDQEAWENSRIFVYKVINKPVIVDVEV